MLVLVRGLIHARHELLEGEVPADDDRRYDEVNALAERDCKKSTPTSFHRDGFNLMRKMKDYKKNHLLFVSDLGFGPDNSRRERLARIFKRRQHAYTAFRSDEDLGSVRVDDRRRHGNPTRTRSPG